MSAVAEANPSVLTAGLALPAKPPKPRSKGMTSVIDYGPDNMGWTGPRGIADMLECAAEYIDFAKIYAMNALLLPSDTLRQMVRLYRDADVRCYSGGILFEHAHRRGEVPALLRHLRGVGFTDLEISENYIVLKDDERLRYFDACRRAGLNVIYEFGRKNPEQALRLEKLNTLINEVLAAGVRHIIIEQSEITLTVREDPAVLQELGRQPWFDQTMIEADTFDFPRHHLQLMQDFGNDVNLANVAPGQVLRLEGLRRGIGRAVDYSMFKSGYPPGEAR